MNISEITFAPPEPFDNMTKALATVVIGDLTLERVKVAEKGGRLCVYWPLRPKRISDRHNRFAYPTMQERGQMSRIILEAYEENAARIPAPRDYRRG
jgi:hypothetical protein